MTGESSVRLPSPAACLQELDPVPILDGSVSPEEGNKLEELLEEGHATTAPLRNPKLIFHNHLPHVLGSAYALGANIDQLDELYEHEIKGLVHSDDVEMPGDSITPPKWRDFLNRKSHTVEYVKFFDEEIRSHNNDWKPVLEKYLFTDEEPLINGFVGGLGHPFIHLAYAWELQSSTVASEALSLGCTEYFGLHGLLDHYPPDNSTFKTTSLADVIKKVHDDERLDGLFTDPGITNMGVLLEKRFDVLLEHWNAWEATDPLQQLEHCCDVSMLLAFGTGSRELKYDFFLMHTMTVAHAVRVLWHFLPKERHACILRQYALFVIMIYICQLKPTFDVHIIDSIDSVSLDGRDWDFVVSQALTHTWYKDAHFFKAVRGPKVFEKTYGTKDNFYLKAAAKFVDEFDGWEGFGLGVEGFIPSRDGYIYTQR
ncbi:uncharacterized protein N7482_003047 [Penicillium canariense]|uniref:Uncharacterized protein n=1 Tax=Penicillium canariense TaxID=189055 RepID=A0A9W9LV24_9EURO|nr:uncharacterized protein N7482_003047 [Penicillium canariense]KAJ5177170.1 hypothetical protein N7482_003047 [Penicillium canariense]